MPDIQIEGGEVLANLDERTLTGLLLPYGEEGRTNVGRFTVMAGDIAIPEDPSVVSINEDHDRFRPIGRATRLWETTAGIMATFAIGRTAAGDAALADTTRRCLSAEFKTGIKNGRATGGVLAAAAKVARGAFPSAQVLAADAEIDDETVELETGEEATVAEDHSEVIYTDEDGRTYRRVYDSVTTEEATENGTETTITTTITEEQTEADAEVETEQENEVSATAIPATHRNGAPAATANPRETDPKHVFAALATLKHDRQNAEALAVLAQLSDIVIEGPAGLPTGGNVIRPNWLGKLYQGIPYVQEYLPLFKPGTDISAGGKGGYTIHRGTSGNPLERFDATWAGNKEEIASGVGHTKARFSTLDRFAFGADIGREFFDLPGGAEVVQDFIELIVEDHLKWADDLALDVAVTIAGAPIAPTVYPGVAGHDFPDALGQMIQGILAVKRKKADGRRDVPTFVIANEAAYEELIYTPKDLIPEFVKFSANTDEGGTADGLTLVVGDTGIEDTPSVIVGSDRAVDFDQLAGGPLHIDALDLARGGVDKAVHAYLQTLVVRADAIVHVGIPDA